ncbi:MAG: ATP-binding protein [Candidatus Hermodarchaeota archaeon]
MNKKSLYPYKCLAETLNKVPHGFPEAKDGITHLKVLMWIYSKEEAKLVSKMKVIGETVEELSTRLDIPIKDLKDKLEEMVSKGQIQEINTSTGRRFALMPFIGGIFEEQLNRLDFKSAQLMINYLKQFKKNHIFDTNPAFFRIIPINKVIKPELTIYPFEQAKHLIERSKSWGIRECICKKQQGLIGNPCKYPPMVCINFSKKENAFTNHSITQPITKEEALFYLGKAEEAGLIHSSMNVQSGHYMLCNCCTCCCGILRAVSEWKYPKAYVKSRFQIEVDSELCEGCEKCVDRCQFKALEVINDSCSVNLERCVGCGVCALTCPENALSLVVRAGYEYSTPPETLKEWAIQKALSRNVDLSDI